MNTGARALLIFAALWATLAASAWFANNAIAKRNAEHPRLWATSDATGQTYDVFEIRERGRFVGFDLEAARVRFPDCDPPAAGADEDDGVHCMDSAGKRWKLTR